jgi:ATP-binding cassette subfamily B protein
MVSTLNLRAVFLIIPITVCVFAVIGISMKLSYPRYAKMQTALDNLNTTLREYLTGIRLVKAFRRFDTEEARFGGANDSLAGRSVEAGRVMAILGPFMQFFSQLGIAGIIFLGARWVGAGDMEVGSIMAFVVYMQQILQSLNMISNILNMIVRVKTSGERVAEVFGAETPERVEEPRKGRDETAKNADMSVGYAMRNTETPNSGKVSHKAVLNAKPASPMIQFDNVSFAYKGSTGLPALQNVSFSVPRGATVGVIGPTGSGKTSLAAMLLRFYNPGSGRILIGGTAIEEIPDKTLRKAIAVVPQTPTLFSGTIKENILWGKPGASDEEVRSAAVMACADEFIESRGDAYEQVIGQSGINLSGGQKQRLSIARALIRKPDILVLDDCTSALDVITETKVKENIAEYADGMTCVLITQRISTVMSCDLILTLDGGQVAGFGTHARLMEECAVYRDIYRSQIGMYE